MSLWFCFSVVVNWRSKNKWHFEYLPKSAPFCSPDYIMLSFNWIWNKKNPFPMIKWQRSIWAKKRFIHGYCCVCMQLAMMCSWFIEIDAIARNEWPQFKCVTECNFGIFNSFYGSFLLEISLELKIWHGIISGAVATQQLESNLINYTYNFSMLSLKIHGTPCEIITKSKWFVTVHCI